jgi:ribonucleoside-diphosphate reductase alpha chain
MSQLLHKIVNYIKYARYTDNTYTHKEDYQQVAQRTIQMFQKKLKQLHIYDNYQIQSAFEAIQQKKILPSMRAMQFAGEAIERNPQRIFNCTYKAVTSIRDIVDIFYMLLCGCGVGYSVRKKHIEKLPIRKPTQNITDKNGLQHPYTETYIVEDTIEGWADAVLFLLEAYFHRGLIPYFDYSQIRPAGTILKTTGGIAPGPEPLKQAINQVQQILEALPPYQQLTSLQVSDIICILAHCVLSGGNRRSALIGLFDWDDKEMYASKHGNWFEKHAYRSRANISAMPTYDVSFEAFRDYMLGALDQGWGEPGYVFTNDWDANYGVNPCSEIGLRDGGACNLCEINMNAVQSEEEFYQLCRYAAIIGTIQATFTNFSYVQPVWQETCEADALLGVGLTGIQTSVFVHKAKKNNVLDLILELGALEVKATNLVYSKLLSIKPAKRLTTIKPAGSTSCILECSSGIHPAYAPYYIRRVRISKNAAIYQKIKELAPSLIEDALDNPQFDAVVSVPVKMITPSGKYTKDISAIEQIEEATFFYKHWVKKGHIQGKDSHNVSLTVHFKPEEKEALIKKLFENRYSLRCVSVFPICDAKYPQQPFEEITEQQFETLEKEAQKIEPIFNTVIEDKYTPLEWGGACDGLGCEIL